MLVFQYNSEHRERLQVSWVTSESTVGISPTGHSLGGLPSISGAPNQKLQNHSKDINSHASPSYGDLCLSSYEERKPSAPNIQINGQKENIASPPHSQRLTQAGCAGKRWQQTRLWQELGPNFATVTPVPLTAVGMGQCLQARPSSPLSATRPRTYSCPCANQPLNCMAGAGGGKQF